MLRNILFFVVHLYCCWCHHATYELDVEGEALHGYYVTVGIGRPAQNIKLIIDTGSANFVVAVIPPLKGSKNFFHYNESNTFQKLGSNIEIKYVQGSWSGFLATDFVNVSKNHSTSCIISCMTSTYDVFDANSKFAGILGLAYSTISKPNSSVLPFFDTIRKEKKIKNIFSLSLCGPFFSNSGNHTSCGKLHLGFISTRHYLNDIIYTPIVEERFYEIILTMIKVGSQQIPVSCKELNDPRTHIDTGTTQLLVSSSVFNKIVTKIKEDVADKTLSLKNTDDVNSMWLNETAACIPKKSFNISFFPDLALSLYHTDNSSFDLVISPEDYLLPWQGERSAEDTCFLLGIGKSDVGTILGSTLLKSYYVVFDRSNKRIGFANSSSWQAERKMRSSSVRIPLFASEEDYSSCRHIQNLNSISAGTVILLFFILILTVLFLYKLISWIQAIRLQQSDNRSDTSSLFGEDSRI